VNAATFSTLKNANDFASALWDILRTLRGAKEDDRLPALTASDLTHFWIGRLSDSVFQAPTKWADARRHPTLNQWAIPVRAWTQILLDISNADATVKARAIRIRNALLSGPTITLADGVTVITNFFWTTDAATTLTRWSGFASKLQTAAELTSDWRPAGPLS
jgi:hypothetical protein